MRYALLLALALGCNPTASPPATIDSGAMDAGAADAPPPTSEIPDVGDGEVVCPVPAIFCGGACVPVADNNCGVCGRVCPSARVCCGEGRTAFCGTHPDCTP